MMMMSEKRQRLWEIMNELHGGVKKRKDDRASLNVLHSRDSVVRYHGLYVDASRERFYLPKKWQLSGDGAGNWQECGVDYLSNKDEMNGTNLIQNLHWLGCSNQVLNLANKNSDDDQMNDNMMLKTITTPLKMFSLVVVFQTIETKERDTITGLKMIVAYEGPCPR